MPRDFFINGESMVYVRSPSSVLIGAATQFGLADSPIRVSLDFRHLEIEVDAWGRQVPPEVQCMLASCNITMTLVHFDRAVLDECWRLSLGGTDAAGTLPRAGARLGNNAAFGAVNNYYVRLGISSPVSNKPWVFKHCYMTGNPGEFPLGTERSVVTVNFKAIPYTRDPWNDGAGALDQVLWDYSDPTQLTA